MIEAPGATDPLRVAAVIITLQCVIVALLLAVVRSFGKYSRAIAETSVRNTLLQIDNVRLLERLESLDRLFRETERARFVAGLDQREQHQQDHHPPHQESA